MQRWFSRTFSRLSGTTAKLILLMAGFLVLWGMLAPITTIVWWLNQSAESLGLKLDDESKKSAVSRQATVKASPKINCYIVFLPGIGNFSPNEITEGERYFIDQLAARHSNCIAVKDVFPYSVRNKDLGSQVLAPFWQAAEKSEGFPGYVFIQIRNLWRFAISADDRYGPVYNLSIARTIVARMKAAHPIPSDQRVNLILISTSGGTQVALGATAHLREWINARISVVSIGGTFEGRAGFNNVDHVYHLYGDRDWVTQLPRLVFPARWSLVVGSPVNQARQQGRYTVCNVGNQKHDGSQGYFGDAIAFNQTSYVQQTLEQVTQLPLWSLDQPLKSVCPPQKAALK